MSASNTNPPPKPEVFNKMLQLGRVNIQVDARHTGVVVPERYKNTPALILCYGHNLRIPISDLSMELTGIRATLSFNGVNQKTFVPWSAICHIFDDQENSAIWPEDVPVMPEAKPHLEAVAEDAEPTGHAPIGHAGWVPRVVS